MSFLLPQVSQEASLWLRSVLPSWARWNAKVDAEVARTQTMLTPYGLRFVGLLTPAEANALVGKDASILYACSGDPSGGAGGSGWYQWVTATSLWVKFS